MPKKRAETARFPGNNVFHSPADFPNRLKQDLYVSGTPYAYKYLEKRASGCPLHSWCHQDQIDTKRRVVSTEPEQLASDGDFAHAVSVVEQIWKIFLPDIYPPAAT
jgi:hypothetical protein